jgi:hypothetical protein
MYDALRDQIVTTGIAQGINITPPDRLRFDVVIVENGYMVNCGAKTFICADLTAVGERIVALLAAKQMDKL